MFSNGHNPTSALEKYTAALQLELDDEFEFARILADRRIVPDLKYLYRLYDQMFKDKYGPSSGPTAVDSLQQFIAKVNNEHSLTAAMEITDCQLAVAIATPLMKRASELLRQSGELVFVDATGNVDRANCRIFLIMTHCVAPSTSAGLSDHISPSTSEPSDHISPSSSLEPSGDIYQASVEPYHDISASREFDARVSPSTASSSASLDNSPYPSTSAGLSDHISPSTSSEPSDHISPSVSSEPSGDIYQASVESYHDISASTRVSPRTAFLSASLHHKFQELQQKLLNDPETFEPSVDAFLKNYDNIGTDSGLISALFTFGKYSGLSHKGKIVGGKRIGIQPTAVARQKKKAFGRSISLAGHPSKRSFVGEHQYSCPKRKSTEILAAVLPKHHRVHSLSTAVSRGESLGKTTCKK